MKLNLKHKLLLATTFLTLNYIAMDIRPMDKLTIVGEKFYSKGEVIPISFTDTNQPESFPDGRVKYSHPAFPDMHFAELHDVDGDLIGYVDPSGSDRFLSKQECENMLFTPTKSIRLVKTPFISFAQEKTLKQKGVATCGSCSVQAVKKGLKYLFEKGNYKSNLIMNEYRFNETIQQLIADKRISSTQCNQYLEDWGPDLLKEIHSKHVKRFITKHLNNQIIETFIIENGSAVGTPSIDFDTPQIKDFFNEHKGSERTAIMYINIDGHWVNVIAKQDETDLVTIIGSNSLEKTPGSLVYGEKEAPIMNNILGSIFGKSLDEYDDSSEDYTFPTPSKESLFEAGFEGCEGDIPEAFQKTRGLTAIYAQSAMVSQQERILSAIREGNYPPNSSQLTHQTSSTNAPNNQNSGIIDKITKYFYPN